MLHAVARLLQRRAPAARSGSPFRLRYRLPIGALLGATTAVALTAALVGTVVLTQGDLPWIAFLGGVLFASLAALVSQTSKMAWRLARRDKQLQQLKLRLLEEAQSARSAHDTSSHAERKMNCLADLIRDPVLFFGTDLRCRAANAAAVQWFGTASGETLERFYQGDTFRKAEPYLRQVLNGKAVQYELELKDQTGRMAALRAIQAPFPPQSPEGFFLILSRDDAPRAADRKSTRLNSSHNPASRMPSSA
jgi:PAS domain-containing protein